MVVLARFAHRCLVAQLAVGKVTMSRLQVLSLAERLDIHPRWTGRGVVMGIVDLGFYAHADLVRPTRRIRAFVDVSREKPRPSDLYTPRGSAWHGTMTACTAVGSGYASGGRYRGIAPDAEVVLIQVGRSAEGDIKAEHVAAAIRFPVRHPGLGIRILNVSLGVNPDDPAAADVLAAVDEATEAGICVFAAIGNDPYAPVHAPALARSAIAVGGSDDRNTRETGDDARYPSSFDGRPPDLVAPASLLPAPMLPGTPQAHEALALHQLAGILEERTLETSFAREAGEIVDDDERASLEGTLAAVEARLARCKYITPTHQHVDGTSFASPIVAAVAAQMLEAAPTLKPHEIRLGLTSTAVPLPGLRADVQGAGVVQPRLAVEWAEARGART